MIFDFECECDADSLYAIARYKIEDYEVEPIEPFMCIYCGEEMMKRNRNDEEYDIKSPKYGALKNDNNFYCVSCQEKIYRE